MLVNSLKASSVVLAAFLAGQAVAKTDIEGCVSSKTVKYGGASLIWYVPGTGELCEFLDCGGGRAPVKTTVPGCDAYSGTATYSPSFLPGFGAEATASSTGSSPSATALSVASSTTADVSSNTALPSNSIITAAPSTTTSSGDGVSAPFGADSSTISSAVSSAGSSQGAESASTSSASESSSVSQAAAVPTAAVKGAVGMVVGIAAGVAML
ncbi:hypothetical protein F4819DRAFT_448473 [Hypoxylon fuscum]|nr:hypothetical protein F4819DRAFT_448473 [Hypoxylon fuscum]